MGVGGLLWASKMSQWVRGLADKLSNLNPSLELMWLGKPDGRSLIPGIHVKERVEPTKGPHNLHI